MFFALSSIEMPYNQQNMKGHSIFQFFKYKSHVYVALDWGPVLLLNHWLVLMPLEMSCSTQGAL